MRSSRPSKKRSSMPMERSGRKAVEWSSMKATGSRSKQTEDWADVMLYLMIKIYITVVMKEINYYA